MPRLSFEWVLQHFVLVLAAVFMFCAPNVDFARELTWHDGQRGLQVVVLAASLLYLICRPSRPSVHLLRPLSCGNWIIASAAIFFLLGAISSAMANLPRWAFLEWGMTVALIIFTMQIAAARNTSNPAVIDRVLLWTCFAMATAYCVKAVMLYAVMFYAGPVYGMPFNVIELYSGFSNPRFFGQFAVMVTPLLVLPALFWASSNAQRLVMGGVPAVWWMLVIASGSRGAWISLIVGALAALLYVQPTAMRWLRWQGICALAGAILYAILFMLAPRLLTAKVVVASPIDRQEGWATMSHRDELWAQTLQMIADHPWLGVGPMHFSWHPNGIGAHPHNAILQIIAEWGVPAGLFLFFVLMCGAIIWRRHVRTDVRQQPDLSRSMVCVALLAALAGAATHSLVDGVIVMPVSQMTLVLMCGWAWGMVLAERSDFPVSPESSRFWGLRLIAGIALFAILQGMYPFIGHIAQREQAYFDAHPGVLLQPRFWAQGWINE